MKALRMFASADTCTIRGVVCSEGLADGEVGDERKVVGGDERGGCAYELGFDQLKGRLVVTVVERDDGQKAGEGRRQAQGVTRAEGVEGFAQQMRGEAARPLVEVSDDEARRGELRIGEDLVTEQEAGLAAAFVEAGAEVHVENVEELRAELDVGAKRAALFAARGEVVVVPLTNGET